MADVDRYMLTTKDNPFNPYTQWNEWWAWDEDKGYHSSGLLDRIAKTSDELSDHDYHDALRYAVDRIIEEDVLDIYKRVYAPDLTVEGAISR
jgi:hypothetical protein